MKNIFVSILLLFSILLSQNVNEDNAVTLSYKLIKTEKMDESVTTILFSSADSDGVKKPTFCLTENNVINYNNIQILSKSGNISGDSLRNSIPIQYTENLEYFGIQKILKEPTKDSIGSDIFYLYSSDGNLLYEDQFDTDIDFSIWQYKICNSGMVIKYNAMKGIFQQLDLNGNIINEAQFQVQKDFNSSRIFNISYSTDNQYIAVLYQDLLPEQNLPILQVYLLDNSLKIIKNYKLCGKGLGDIYISPENKYLITSSFKQDNQGFTEDKKIIIINTETDEIKMINNYIAAQGARFLNNNEVILKGSNTLIVYDLKNSIIKYEFTSSSGKIFSYDFVPEKDMIFLIDGSFSTLNRQLIYRRPEIKILDLTKPSQESVIYYKRLDNFVVENGGALDIYSSDNAEQLFITFENTIYTYEKE